MASVQINQTIINSIASAFQINLENIIRQLADQHNFDAADAIAQFCDKPPTIDTPTISTPTINTPTNKSPNKFATPDFALPWTNQPITHCCDALRSYYGVFSQCTNLKHGASNFCKTCSKKGETPPCGTIHDRANDCFVAPNGKKPFHYTIFMKKVGKTEQQVRNELAKFDITIDDNFFNPPKVGRGRPKKSVTVVDDSDDNKEIKKSAGRPKKVVHEEPSVDDLIHNLDPQSPPPSLSQSLTIDIPNDMIVSKQNIPVSPNDDD